MSERKEFIREVLKPGSNMSALCRHFGISRKTGYKWLRRYCEGGEAGLVERSRRPQHSPRQTADSVEGLIVAARERHPAWGARKLKRWLENQGQTGLPVPSTITAILGRHNLLDPAESLKHRPYQRFEMAQPNELWQMDFKGHFDCRNGQGCHPLTVLDDHSRFLLALKACPNERRQTVQTHLTDLFRQYGLPERMLMDNGSPWGDKPQTRFTRLTAWLLLLGIRVSHGRPYHPQTQGKVERLHGSLHAELLSRYRPHHLPDAQQCCTDWRALYNTQRPHEALDMQVPETRYQPSPHPFPEILPQLIYPDAFAVRKVQDGGRISFRARRWRVGKAFIGHPVGLQPDGLQDGLFHVYFSHTRIRTLDFRAV